MRLIDADALKEFIDDCRICDICPQKAPRCSYDCDFPEVVTEKWDVAIDAQPTIEPKRGEWKRRIVDNGFNADWVCSECGYRVKTDFVDYNFCPNCGADMREREGE